VFVFVLVLVLVFVLVGVDAAALLPVDAHHLDMLPSSGKAGSVEARDRVHMRGIGCS
jgi:hypothetical protein